MYSLDIGERITALLIVDSRDSVPTSLINRVSHSHRDMKFCLIAYNRFPWSLSAIGASGSLITPQALVTSTSNIALRFNFRVIDFEPRVATSLNPGD